MSGEAAEASHPAHPAHLYVHVPFCTRKCDYCDFVSSPLAAAGGEEAIRRYLTALAREAEWYATHLAPAPVETVYVGGGTPTTLSAADLSRLFRVLNGIFGPWPVGAEVTVEANPGTIDTCKLAALLEAGVNRLSLGVQSFDEGLLRRVGRLTTAAQVRESVVAARTAGVNNLSLDFIFGLPGQTVAGFAEDLRKALDLGPEHLSAYALTVEEGTPLGRAVARGEVSLPGEDAEADMLALAGEVLTHAGYRQYEVSNFARPGREARHNLAYWRNADYLALGPAASGHTGLLRYHNTPDLQEYVGRLSCPGGSDLTEGEPSLSGDFPLAPAANRVERLTVREAMGETAFLALRMLGEGLDRAAFAQRFGRDPSEVWGAELERLSTAGLLEVLPARLRLTPKGLPLANLVFAAFV